MNRRTGVLQATPGGRFCFKPSTLGPACLSTSVKLDRSKSLMRNRILTASLALLVPIGFSVGYCYGTEAGRRDVMSAIHYNDQIQQFVYAPSAKPQLKLKNTIMR